ncbi:hypothetical protein CMV_010969, partial [Castanea mollissima]
TTIGGGRKYERWQKHELRPKVNSSSSLTKATAKLNRAF